MIKNEDKHDEKKDYYKDFISELKSNKYLVTILIIYIIFTHIPDFLNAWDEIYFRFSNRNMTDEELREEAVSLSEEIFSFLKERRLNEPVFDHNKWDESVEISLHYGTETMQLYNTNFASRIAIVREEFLKRNVKDGELEMFYAHPTNQFGIEKVALRLAAMSTMI